MRPSAARPLPALVAVPTAALLALTACGSSPEAATGAAPADVLVVEHAQGTTEVPRDPQRVVVHDLSVLDTLDALGVEVVGVPDFEAGDALPGYEDVETVGTLHEPDVEAVAALEPDLVVVAARSSTSFDALSEVAPTIDLTVDQADFLPSARERVETLGEIFGLEDEVAERLDAVDALAEETAALAADAGTGLVVMTSAAEVGAYGAGSRFGLVHDELGVAPADPDIPEASHGDVVSFEYLAETDPDHLFVLDRDAIIGEGGTAAAEVLDNPLVARTAAARAGDVHYLDSFAWYIAPSGLTSLETMVGEVHAALA